MSNPDFGSLRQRFTIEQVKDMLNLKMTLVKDDKGNEKYRGTCPGCNSSSPTALTITPSRQQFKCWVHKDKPWGDLIDLVSHVRQIGKREAALWILAQEEKHEARPNVQATPPKAIPVLDYLNPDDKRLPVAPETARYFEGGFAAKGPLSGRFGVAMHDADGTYLGVCGLAVSPEQDPQVKFYTGFDPTPVIFNAHRLQPGDLFLVRTPLEVIRAYEAGETNVVCFMTDAITSNQWAQLAILMHNKGCPVCYPHF